MGVRVCVEYFYKPAASCYGAYRNRMIYMLLDLPVRLLLGELNLHEPYIASEGPFRLLRTGRV